MVVNEPEEYASDRNHVINHPSFFVMNSTIISIRMPRVSRIIVLITALSLTACDSSTGVGGEADATIRGQVTDDAGFGKTAGAVEGALVTASGVRARGNLTQLEGQATTDAEGRFALDVDDASEYVVLTAQKGSFRTKALVYTAGKARVNAMPMTTESHAEADVYVEAREADGGDDEGITAADVALYVTREVAADIASGRTTTAAVAAAIRAAVDAEREYVAEEEGEVPDEEIRKEKREAFLRLQADLAASANTSARSEAVEAFQEAVVQAHAAAGVAAETQAKARQAGRAALVKYSSNITSDARFSLRREAEIVAALATAQAIEAQFEAAGASSARLSALAQARTTLIARLRAAGSSSAIADAQAEYASDVEAELASEMGVNASLLATASTAIALARTSLDVALTTATSARAVAGAYASFYATAETSAEESLTGTAKAGFGATVLTLLSVQ